MIDQTYGTSLSLLTDLYQLTMGYGYWQNGMHNRRSVFHLFFRQCPFGGQYAIAAGLQTAVEWLRSFEVSQDDVEYLATLQGNDGQSLFSSEFLATLQGLRLSVDIDAVPEGTVVFAHQPLIRVTGPLWQCQWIETALLNIVNFQTLIATKAARVCDAARGDSVLEFGLRRAQGIDGALSASRAAYIGGCVATSNVLAGKIFGIPVKGTHAHSWVMSFDGEIEAFDAYADAMPNNCVFLVDTYDTIEGVKSAIEIGKRLRNTGHEMVGVRLDSGDLAQLSIAARKLLDEAGFPDASIVASNDLDEYAIFKLKTNGAKIAVWGVGTNLVTARDQPALGGVYKLAAIADDEGNWQPKVKLSEQVIKTSTPGIQQVRRYYARDAVTENEMMGDTIYCELIGAPKTPCSESLALPDRFVELLGVTHSRDLLVEVLRGGDQVAELPKLSQIRDYAKQQRGELPADVRSITNNAVYPTGLEIRLAKQKRAMIKAARG
ncbi:nicotinate phosphoribosyltransferase [Planctomycetes bacterium K23_9]|uniref:Nicotinate phosphoribosyltransferase n=1 Tax=Stieleria marina TaxID=1930275 RepID=A0A517P1E2_9BACT|nr:Nicotinate phosphoribosyltransferase pncB2 [Planctomycetes bacterium K23_9]